MENNNIFFDRDVGVNDVLNAYVPVSSALTWERIKPPLETAFVTFVRPLLGDAVCDAFVDIVHAEATEGEDGELVEPVVTDVQKHAIDLIRRAVANLAFWYDFNELSIHITDQGFQRQEGDSFKSLYRYQEIELKQQFKNKGFNALDELVNYLHEHVKEVPEFAKCPAYMDVTHSVVRGASEIELYCHINRSAIVYLMLKPDFKLTLECALEPLMGPAATELLHTYLEGGLDPDSEDAVKAEKLRHHVAAVVILMSMARFVKTVGSVTDRGLYFTQTAANGTANDEQTPASEADRLRKADEFNRLSDSYLHRLVSFIELELPGHYAGDPHDVLNRDNNDKKTFFA